MGAKDGRRPLLTPKICFLTTSTWDGIEMCIEQNQEQIQQYPAKANRISWDSGVSLMISSAVTDWILIYSESLIFENPDSDSE